jgi:hypothetical protein
VWAAGLLGDWQLNGILTLMSGRPMNFGSTISVNTPGSSSSPDQTGPSKILHGIAGPGGSALWFDTSVFVQPLNADGRTPHFGNVGPNSMSGPGLGNLDLSLFRKIRVTERWRADLRFETFNFTNTPAFANPNTTVGSTDFGKVTSTLAGTISNQTVGGIGARVVQLGLKISF